MTDSGHKPRESESAAAKPEPSRTDSPGAAGQTGSTAAKQDTDRASPANGAKPTSPAKGAESTSPSSPANQNGQADQIRQLIVTLSDVTGEIVQIEKLGPHGQRTQLSGAEYETLALDSEADEYETALEEAYEAGIADALSEVDGDDETEEAIPLGNLVFGRVVLRQMLERKVQQEVLSRVIEERLFPKRSRRPAGRR